MTVRELARLGQEMRQAQRTYFRSRSPADLERSKGLERRFDLACKDATEQPTFFDREQAS